MKKADKVLGLAALAVCLVLFLIQQTGMKSGVSVIVEKDGEAYGTYDLSEDCEVDIAEDNCIVIENKTVRMKEANCPDHLCIRQGTVSKDGQMIVCLPNRVTVRIVDETGMSSVEDVPDAVAG